MRQGLLADRDKPPARQQWCVVRGQPGRQFARVVSIAAAVITADRISASDSQMNPGLFSDEQVGPETCGCKYLLYAERTISATGDVTGISEFVVGCFTGDSRLRSIRVSQPSGFRVQSLFELIEQQTD